MIISDVGLALIKSYEGCRLTAYDINDGMITIGWGHAEPKGNTKLVAGVTTWTQAKADEQLKADVKVYGDSVNNYFTRDFNQNQFDALTSFAYNLGAGVFSSYGWSKTASDDWICSQLPLYRNAGTQFEQGLLKRRNAEVALFKKPYNVSNKTIEETKKLEEEDEPMFLARDPKNGKVFWLVAGKWSYINNTGMLNNIKKTFPDIKTVPLLENEVKDLFAQNK